ncbi:MAG: ABC transporter permease, partial [Sphingomonadales bacterium]|nr:ABC transporter permease [Sphingomonadales bacterium]
AALIALGLSLPVGVWLAGHPRAARWLAPMLALPHAGFAIGFAFLIAPSGWIARGLAGPMGWAVPSDVASLGDPLGLALMAGLALKELPFLLLVTLAALGGRDWRGQMIAGRACGYRAGQVWRLVIWPQLWPALRLPMAIVIGYGLSVTDMALILGPSHPPSLAVQALRLYTRPDLGGIGPGAVLSLVILGLWGAIIAAGLLAERLIAGPGRGALRRALRGPQSGPRPLALSGPVLFRALGLITAAALIVLALWSVAVRWPFPAALPQGISAALWARGGWAAPMTGSLILGLAVTALSLGLAILILETESRSARPLRLGALIAAPLVLPQIGFLQGLGTALLWLGLPPGWPAVIWATLVLTFPYALLMLAGPWHGIAPELIRSATSLGAPPGRVLTRIRLPLLARPLALTAATAFAVALGQYLSVLLPGAGRVPNLATEAVALASGADRRLAAQMGLLQSLLPLLAFALALIPGRRTA